MATGMLEHRYVMCDPRIAASYIGWAADAGHIPAMADMGTRYANGDIVKQWDFKAYERLLRAREGGADVDAILAEVEARLPEVDKERAHRWLGEGRKP